MFNITIKTQQQAIDVLITLAEQIERIDLDKQIEIGDHDSSRLKEVYNELAMQYNASCEIEEDKVSIFK